MDSENEWVDKWVDRGMDGWRYTHMHKFDGTTSVNVKKKYYNATKLQLVTDKSHNKYKCKN